MKNDIELTCVCGEKLTADLSEQMNEKDIVHCDCGRTFLVVEITS